MLEGEMVLPIVGETLVEACVLLVGDIVGLAHPDGLDLVKDLHLLRDLLDLLGLLGLVLILDLFDLGLVLITVFLLIFLLVLLVVRVRDFTLGALLDLELNGERDELGVLLDEVLQATFLEVLSHIVLKLKDDLGTTGDILLVVDDDAERATGIGDPFVLDVIVMLRDDGDLLGNKVSGVESDTELTDHANISTSGDGFHEGTGARLGDGTKVVDEVGLLHTYTSVPDGKSVVGLIGDDLDSKVGLGLKLLGLLDRLVSDLVQSVGGVGNQLSKEDLLVRVEGVDDE